MGWTWEVEGYVDIDGTGYRYMTIYAGESLLTAIRDMRRALVCPQCLGAGRIASRYPWARPIPCPRCDGVPVVLLASSPATAEGSTITATPIFVSPEYAREVKAKATAETTEARD